MSKLNEIDGVTMMIMAGGPIPIGSEFNSALPTGQQIDTGKRVAVTEPHFGRQSAVCG